MTNEVNAATAVSVPTINSITKRRDDHDAELKRLREQRDRDGLVGLLAAERRRIKNELTDMKARKKILKNKLAVLDEFGDDTQSDSEILRAVLNEVICDGSISSRAEAEDLLTSLDIFPMRTLIRKPWSIAD